MLRLTRIFLACLTTFSLLVLISLSILWLRSYRHTDRLTSVSTTGQKSLYSRQGHLVLNYLHADWSNQPASRFGIKYDRDTPAPPSEDLMVRLLLCTSRGVTESFHERAGFALYQRNRPDGVQYVIAVAPFWALAAASGLLPLGWTVQRLRRRFFSRPVPGCCERCGYDLRATPQRCPECGHVPSSPTGA